MAVFVRAKRVTDPLNDHVKACLCGHHHRHTGCPSDSDNDAGADDASLLSDLVHGFLEQDQSPSLAQDPETSDTESESGSDLDQAGALQTILNPAHPDAFRCDLLSRVSAAADALAELRPDPPALRRAVAKLLRDSGYNAGVCSTKWESSGGLTAGSYEFIDVLRSKREGKWKRYLVDLDFAAEFEIARPTPQYEALLRALPRVFVVRAKELLQAVCVTADAAKRSLKSRGLHLPPWRNCRYMQAKWLGPYKRTAAPPVQPPCSASLEQFPAKCRSVGFDAAGSCRLEMRIKI